MVNKTYPETRNYIRQTPHYNGISYHYIEQIWNTIYPAIDVALEDLDDIEVIFSTRESEDIFSSRASYHIKMLLKGQHYYLKITERLIDDQPELRHHQRIDADFALPAST
ncbi:uncharacterized protein LOC108683333 isoform X2 [Hyalella azteca]|nr:uncharacterized protein LOC108683333 isoform X2 [Hyalella azteca]